MKYIVEEEVVVVYTYHVDAETEAEAIETTGYLSTLDAVHKSVMWDGVEVSVVGHVTEEGDPDYGPVE